MIQNNFTAFDALHNYIAVIDNDGRVQYTNPSFVSKLGNRKSIFEIIQDQRLSDSLKKHIQSSGRSEYMFSSLLSGHVYYFHVTGFNNLFVCNGQSEDDIEHMYELQVSSRKKMLDIKTKLLEICMFRKTNFEATLRKILQSAAEILRCERVSYWLVDPNMNSITCRKLYYYSQMAFEPDVNLSLQRKDAEEYFDYINKEFAFVMAEDTATHPATRGFEETYSRPNNIRSLLDVPVWHNGKLHAIICCEQVGVKKRWQLEEAQFMLSLSDSLALCLQTRDRLLAEAKLAETNKKLQRSNTDLEHFAVAAAHDIKSPLRTMVNFLGLLKKRHEHTLEPVALEYIDYTMKNATQLSSLINDMLSYSKVEQQIAPPEPVNLNKLVEEICTDQQEHISARNGRVEVKALLPQIVAPRNLLYQMFSNIIHNAMKYSHTSQPPLLEIEVEYENGFCHISFADNGIGIDDRYAEKIFSLFGRGHSEEKYDGTGIGLATCRKIAEMLNGKIVYQRRENPEGSIFIVTLPMQSN